MSAGRTGRRPGDPEVTRQAILAAARTLFGRVGFDRATVRAIAAEAEVDPALIHHHFGTKQGLFAAAHELPVNPAELIAAIAGGPVEERGERIARAYLSILAPDGLGGNAPAVSLIRAAATNEAAARMLREFVEAVLLRNAASLVDLPHARLRLSLIGSHMIGVVFARTVIGIPELRDADVEVLIAALAPTIQRYLTDPDLGG